MKFQVLVGVLLVACLLTTLAVIPIPATAAGELLKTDFQQESFTKTVDYFKYARAWALSNGLPKPNNFWHAYAYVTYVNKMGFQMLYAGLCNISLADLAYFTVPMQNILMHYKTETNNRDVIVSSSFLMLMGFNDTADSIYPDSPDRNDTLWASFSFGINLRALFPNVTFPSLNSKSEVFPLTASADKLTWKWGMRYTNLTAFWITTSITNENKTETSMPWGLATYDELTFNYTLAIDPNAHRATISQDHAIGRMRDLWTFWGLLPIHYNSTGTYLFGAEISNENIYEFLEKHDVKMSIVDFQTSIMLDRKTYSLSANGQNVTDNEVDVTDSTISTYAEGGEKIFDAGFGGVKETYKLFNYTDDPTESTADVYPAVTRTPRIDGYARNRNLFRFHRNFAMYLPLVLVHMYPQMPQQLYQRAKDTITNMTRADCLYLISYPTYSGYRIEHDPQYTAYFAPTTTNLVPNLGGLIVIAAIVSIVIIVAVIILRKRGPKQQTQPPTQQPSTPPAPPPI